MKLQTRNRSACGVPIAAGLLAVLSPAMDSASAREPLALTASQALRAEFDRLPEAQLQRLVLQCEREAAARLLDAGEGVPCATALDALLERVFRGDFTAFLSWWRAERGGAAHR